MITADGQGMSEVFDKDFELPSDGPELNEFNVKQTIVMSIFVKTMKTAKSLAIVRKHAPAKTAHACFQELCRAYLHGTVAA
jgi:hypothetical protein